MKKWKIQEIVFMIMLTRSSERIFIPMRYTAIHMFVGVSEYDRRILEVFISELSDLASLEIF